MDGYPETTLPFPRGETSFKHAWQLRTVVVLEDDCDIWTGLFHCWCNTTTEPIALIETSGGQIKYVAVQRMRFTDRE